MVQKAKFEYSPLGKLFNKGLDESDKKERLLKRLKNIEDKSGEQLKTTENKKDNQLGIKSAVDIIDEKLSLEAKNIFTKLTNQEKLIKYKWLYFKPSNANEFDFREYNSLKELFKANYYRNLKIEDTERKQDEFMTILNALDKYGPRIMWLIMWLQEKILINAKKFYDGRQMIINAFKDKIFPLSPDEGVKVDASRGEDEDEDEFYTPRELETIPELSSFENEEETPRNMPDLETEQSAQRRKYKGDGLKILTHNKCLVDCTTNFFSSIKSRK